MNTHRFRDEGAPLLLETPPTVGALIGLFPHVNTKKNKERFAYIYTVVFISFFSVTYEERARERQAIHSWRPEPERRFPAAASHTTNKRETIDQKNASQQNDAESTSPTKIEKCAWVFAHYIETH